jgi:PhzF family phenazine biosynthesis protein
MAVYRVFQVDAFTDRLFGGNPAAVCPLNEWLPDSVMQDIAMENNLAETAFFVRENDHFRIRWFTPMVEVDLCGHATLASAWVIFNQLAWPHEDIRFMSRSGWLTVKSTGDLLTLDFPVDDISVADPPQELISSLGFIPLETYKGKTDWMAVVGSQAEVLALKPDLGLMTDLTGRGVIVTAPGDSVDFVSRFFAPQSGVPEDPVTGSAHTTLAPYWGKRLGKNTMTAMQLSRRTGHLTCSLHGDRVEISGKAKLYMEGEIFIPVMG